MKIRIFIQKKEPFDISSKKLFHELKKMNFSLSRVIIYYIYDIFHIEKKIFIDSLYKIFVDPVTDILHKNKNFKNPHFSVEYIPGKYDLRADSAIQCIKIIDPKSRVFIKTGKLMEFIGLSNPKDNLDPIKKFCINPNFFQEKNLHKKDFKINFSKKRRKRKDFVVFVKNFISLSYEEMKVFHKKWNFSIHLNDLLFIQKYFLEEKRNPTEIELRILDTYWSDHCRHTTFFTTLDDIRFYGVYKNIYQNIFDEYLKDRNSIGRSKYPINLMDLSILPSRILYKQGKLKNYVIFPEKNACMIMVDVHFSDIKNKEKWYILFKNETHNYPTEIDPFSGASTCIGGAIRDPLSGRAFVYQAIRLSGSADPTNPKILDNKIPQHKICYDSAYGYSSYGNQVGIATTNIQEIYHEGYRAQRMEVGMVVGAVPVKYVKKETPMKGDVILLIGGLTGRYGIGGAAESSKEKKNEGNSNKNIQIEKGNPIIERQLQRFFRKKEVLSLIKKCNDFGAGGASVAIGELSNSLILNLDKIPTIKNANLEALEIALSESQERMAVVLSPNNVKTFIKLAYEENILSVPIARITDNNRIVFFYKKKEIFNLKSSFLNTGGSHKKTAVHVHSPIKISPFQKSRNIFFSRRTFLNVLSKLNVASQKSLVELFDSTVGSTTILMPFGGKYQMTPSEGSVHKIPVLQGNTDTVSLASWGFHPEISDWSPFHGGIYSIIECISKIVSMGASYKGIYFSFQEYYQKLGNNPDTWGKPFSSLLGAYHAQMSFGLVSIGGKDSMSGTYKNIHVPPTLISFGVTTGKCSNILSPELKRIGNKIYLYHHKLLKNEMPNFDSLKEAYDKIYKGICSGKIISVKTVKDGGISVAIAKMSFGNRLGVLIRLKNYPLFELSIGSLIIESSSVISEENFLLIGEVISSKILDINGIVIEIDEALKFWSKTLNPIFSSSRNGMEFIKKSYKKKKIFHRKNIDHRFFVKKKYKKKIVPNVFIPVFPGTNCELETIHAFKRVGAIIKTFVFKNLKEKDITESIDKMKKYIRSAKIFILCGGFSAGDEPDGSAKFITSILHNPYIKEAIEYFLDHDGLILGICNGFQALIKSGLLPYGKICIRHPFSPTLTDNQIGKHISQCVHIKVISDHSPWLYGMINKIYTIPLSHSEGRFYASKKITNILFKKNQIATQYVDLQGFPTLDRCYNPNGSVEAVEGILSENGKIYGRMTHPERYHYGLLKNIPDIKEHSIFRNAVHYFL
ncbi:phosphoribosylformylglycinamidine synthase [Blattabacterium cuenoti]|uniref:phosphoribosylformylglycinamidine synthase n=1 Tax=Blattabacterium cuenoti TaxID=1653831 RepID=UPI00163C29E4|nr:phosphoribosylformylglycinamidine synthase [Blattabacterium cuenoti]